MQQLKANTKGITLIALIVTIIVLLILSGISIHVLIGKNRIIDMAKSAINKNTGKEEEEQKYLNDLNEHFNNTDETKKPELPDVDTSSTIKYIAYSDNDTELGENPKKILAYPDTTTFNEVFTVYNYKLTEPAGNVPQGYFADYPNNRTRQLAYEFNTTCQKFEIQGVGGFRLSVWDNNKNKWKYIESSNGISEETDGKYLVTFPDQRERSVRIEAREAFYRLDC